MPSVGGAAAILCYLEACALPARQDWQALHDLADVVSKWAAVQGLREHVRLVVLTVNFRYGDPVVLHQVVDVGATDPDVA